MNGGRGGVKRVGIRDKAYTLFLYLSRLRRKGKVGGLKGCREVKGEEA